MLYFWDSKILPMHLNISCNHFWYFVPLVLLFKHLIGIKRLCEMVELKV